MIVANNMGEWVEEILLYKEWNWKAFIPIQYGLFRGCSLMGGEGVQKGPPSLKSVTHIMKLGTVYLT